MPTEFSQPNTHELTPVTDLIGLRAALSEAGLISPARPTTEVPVIVPQPSPGEIAYATAEIRETRAELDRLRAERDRLLESQRRIMELLGTTNPDRIVHDLRNVLNERELFRALAESEM